MYNILLVAEAFNRKNGANGTFVDTFKALTSMCSVKVHISNKRYIPRFIELVRYIGFRNALLNNHSFFSKEKYDFLIIQSNMSAKDIIDLRNKYSEAKILTFQTGNITKENLNDSIISNVDGVFFQNNYIFDRLYECLERRNIKSAVTYATCDESRLHEMHDTKTKKYLLSIGSIQPRKNQISLIKTYSKLPQKLQTQYPLLIFGPKIKRYKDYYTEFDHMVSENPNITYLGNQKNYYKYYSAAFACIIASHEEGLSTIVRESLCCGIPIITSDLDGYAEMFKNQLGVHVLKDIGNSDLLLTALTRLQNKSTDDIAKDLKNFYSENFSNSAFQDRIYEALRNME